MMRTPNRPIYSQLGPYKRRCTSTRIHHGRVVRCHDVEGHKSVHYTKETWWPNEPRFNWQTWLFLLLVALTVAAVIGYICWRGVHP
jgi:hypothetical protein